MLDKVLLLLLVLLLPLGLWGGRYLIQSQTAENTEETEKVSASELQTILSQINSTSQPQSVQGAMINITGVTYASESGVLRVAGVAPSQQLSVMVSATVLPSTVQVATAAAELGSGDDGGVLGRAVEVRAVEAGPGGSFVFEYNTSQLQGLIELRFDQADAQATIQYDLEQRKQTF